MARTPQRLGNVPAETTSFIGRRRELAEVRKKLTGARLISLVGPGGVGKTRLAVRQDKQLLLLVDNCEHLLGTAAKIVTQMLRVAPGLRVITTSREPLSISGEHVVPVPPLDPPDAYAGEPLDHLRQNEAVRLFTERAAAASGAFELTAANQGAVVDVCRRLDGLPLAIELAAVRTRALTPEQIRDRMTNRFDLLTGGSAGALPRHQTLRTTIEWSYDLLTDDERAAMRRLYAFAGRFTLEDIESVAAPSDAPAPRALDIALATSLGWYWVTRANAEGARWLEEFLGSGAGDPVTRAWAYFIRGFLALLKTDPVTARPALATAVDAARRADQRDLLSEALSLASITANMLGDKEASRRLLDEAQDVATGIDYPPGTIAVFQARCLNGFIDADVEAVRSAGAVGARLSRESGDTYAHEMMLLNLGTADLLASDLENAKPLLAESLRIAEQIDDRVAQFHLLDALGCHAALSGQSRHAARLFGAASTARTEVSANVMPFFAPTLARARDSVIAAISKPRFEAEFEAGRRLGRPAAMALALGRPAEIASVADGVAADKAGTGLLAKREAEVAALVAEGLSNRQIGARLFISERTVDSHVRSILNKLGFGSRAQIAAWMASPD
jgi:DNA-binding CsgD family transcriptional regulator